MYECSLSRVISGMKLTAYSGVVYVWDHIGFRTNVLLKFQSVKKIKGGDLMNILIKRLFLCCSFYCHQLLSRPCRSLPFIAKLENYSHLSYQDVASSHLPTFRMPILTALYLTRWTLHVFLGFSHLFTHSDLHFYNNLVCGSECKHTDRGSQCHALHHV